MVVSKIRVSDYISQALSSIGVKYVYGIMGGGASGLNDGFIKNKSIQYICTHHEQGAGYAACGEAKVTRNLAVVNPTTGCGGANCITPLLDAWQDSLPLLFLSGNVKLDQCSSVINERNSCNIRKYGVQESDIISTVKSLTKYSKLIERAEDTPEILKSAIECALKPRMGPVWIDVPSDIQHSLIDIPQDFCIDLQKGFNEAIDLKSLKKAKRPLVLAGYGVYLSNQEKEFRSFIEQHNIPFVTSYLGIDLVPYEHSLNLGSIGIKGSRAGNFAIQNCDYLLILGCSLNCSHTGYDEKLFSPNSYKVQVDIDNNEYKKNKIQIDKFYETELGDFFKNVII
jgi:acetolactate synthase-1/2/3 large subunit